MAPPRISRVYGAVNIGSFRISAMIAGLSETGEMVVLGSGHRIAHGIGRRCHIGDIAALDPLRSAVARAKHDDLARVCQPGNHRRNAERAMLTAP